MLEPTTMAWPWSWRGMSLPFRRTSRWLLRAGVTRSSGRLAVSFDTASRAADSRRVNGLAFVGRVAELTRLEEVVEACRRGERAVAFVGGEAGIGKTRLVTELAERAVASAVEVFVGSCLDLDHGGVPHAPIVEALRELADEPDAADPLGGDTEPVEGPASALQVVQRALAHLGDRRVAVLIVEDVQWANRSTRDLIAYLASTGPTPRLALVLTYRSDDLGPGHPLRAFVAELERRPNVTHLRLDRLGRADAAALLAATLGRPPDPAMTEAMYQRSEGNPFFLQELGRAAMSEPSGELPPLLSDVLTSRVRRLSTGTQQVLRIAAVAGRRVDHDRLAAIVPLDPTMLADALREARDANIITADPDLRHYEFCHALLHEAVYADVLAGERSLYHTEYAELLAAEPGRRGLEAWAALSHHWRAAGRSREALVATIEAGMAAEAWYTTPEAHRYYELALELWSELDAPVAESVPTRLDVLSRAADAASRTGAFARAVELTNTALADIDPAADPTSAGLLHERQAWFLWRAGQEEQALDEYRAAVRMVPPEPPSAARARVLAAHADALERTGAWADARRYAEEAVAIASAVGARFDEGHARHVLGLALGAEGDTDAGIAELHRARLLAEANGDVADVAGTYVHLWRVLAEQRRGDELVQVAVGAADACHAAGMELAGRLLNCLAGGFLSQLGRWQEAEERLQVEEHELWGLLAVANPTVRGLLEVDRGDLAAAREHLETARCLGVEIHDGRIYGLLYRGLAELALWEGRVDDARAAVATGLQLTGDDEMAAHSARSACGPPRISPIANGPRPAARPCRPRWRTWRRGSPASTLGQKVVTRLWPRRFALRPRPVGPSRPVSRLTRIRTAGRKPPSDGRDSNSRRPSPTAGGGRRRPSRPRGDALAPSRSGRTRSTPRPSSVRGRCAEPSSSKRLAPPSRCSRANPTAR
jgi:tetratricopeptide (TPR) repeat protein